MTDGTIVLTQDDTSGTIHKRVQVGKGLASHESDNLDAAGAFTVIGTLDAARDPFRLCERCFPPDDVEDTTA